MGDPKSTASVPTETKTSSRWLYAVALFVLCVALYAANRDAAVFKAVSRSTTKPILPQFSHFEVLKDGKKVERTGYRSYYRSVENAALSNRKVIYPNGTSFVLSEVGKLIQNTSPPNPVASPVQNSFLGTALAAYMNHHVLRLRPDDVWLAIMLSFANYVDKHHEEMRKTFVDHEGKKELVVMASSGLYGNWTVIAEEFGHQIGEHTKRNVRDWSVPDFTTTTVKDRLVGNVVLMGTMKHYFSYSVGTICGIREVILDGSLEDWKKVRSRIDKLVEFADGEPKQEPLRWWHQILAPILDEMINSYQGKVNHDFWQALFFDSGSGGTFASGWVVGFTPFGQNGEWNLRRTADEIVEGFKQNKYSVGGISDTSQSHTVAVEVPVKVNEYGSLHDVLLLAGAFVCDYDEKNDTIRPSYDFLLFDMAQGYVNNSEHEKLLGKSSP